MAASLQRNGAFLRLFLLLTYSQPFPYPQLSIAWRFDEDERLLTLLLPPWNSSFSRICLFPAFPQNLPSAYSVALKTERSPQICPARKASIDMWFDFYAFFAFPRGISYIHVGKWNCGKTLLSLCYHSLPSVIISPMSLMKLLFICFRINIPKYISSGSRVKRPGFNSWL